MVFVTLLSSVPDLSQSPQLSLFPGWRPNLIIFQLAYLAVRCFWRALLPFYELCRVLLYNSGEDEPDHKPDLYRDMSLSSVSIHYNITDIENWHYTVAHMSSCNLWFVLYSIINNSYCSNRVLVIKESWANNFKGKPVIIPGSHSWVVMISSESLIPHVKTKLFFQFAQL